MPHPDEEQYQRDQGVAASNYHVTDLTMPTIDRPPADFENRAKGVAGPMLDTIDWVWKEFDIAGGQGFLETIITPLAGNYNSIQANGTAWHEVGKQFGSLVGNMGANAVTLANEHWEGPAAQEFGRFLEVYWKDGAAWAGEQIGLFLKKGFDRVGQFSKDLAEEAIEVIGRIVNVVARLASRAIPILGQARAVIEFIGKAFGVLDTVIDDINELIELYNKIQGLYGQIESLVESMKGYFQAFAEVVDAVKRIPTVDSLADAAAIGEDITSGTQGMSEQKAEIEQKVTEADQTLDEIEEKAEQAG
jgi:phage-related protein